MAVRTGRAAIAANSILPSNQKLTSDAYFQSNGERHSLSMQTDATSSTGQRDREVAVQHPRQGLVRRLTTKAQLQVVSAGGTPLWSSRPTGTTYSVLDVPTINQWWPTQKLVWGSRSLNLSAQAVGRGPPQPAWPRRP